MEAAARWAQHQPEGLDLLLQTRGAPPFRLTPQALQHHDEMTEETADSASSQLSEPFSEYTALEEGAGDGRQGQLARFSPFFQAAVNDLTEEKPGVQPELRVTRERVRWQQDSTTGDILGAIPTSLMDEPPEVHVQTRGFRSKSGGTEEGADVLGTGDNSTWRMLEQYEHFSLSLPGVTSNTPHWLQQVPLPRTTREHALSKCSAWLEQQLEEEGGVAGSLEPLEPLQLQEQVDEKKDSTKPEQDHSSEIRSKWKREKNIVLACVSNRTP